MRKIFSYIFQAIFVYILLFLGKLSGKYLSRKVFAHVFLWFGPFFRSKTIIEKNLNIFNKKLTENEKEKIRTSMWKNYGITFIEYVFLDSFRKNNDYVKIEGNNNLLKVIQDKKPVIFISGHFANFELMSMEITKKNIPLATIYRPLNNFFLNPFMEFLRKKFVCSNQIKKGIGGVKDTIEFIQKGYSIALMIDQRVSEGERIDFFNKPALTTTLPAQLALKFNLPIVPVFIERLNNGRYKIKFLEIVYSADYGNKIKLSKKLNSILEGMIKKNPGEWIWTHNRWK